MRIGKAMGVLCLAVATLFAGVSLHAQEITGSISGVVLDASGAAIPNATVTVTNTDKNIVVRTLKTDEGGRYVAPFLPIGRYTVLVEANGFKKTQHTSITLNVNDKLTVNFTLEVGTVTEVVTVTASVLQVETRTATAAGLINPIEIREIPLNNRNWEQLVTLMPGVSSNASDELYIGTTNPSGQTNTVSFSINGQRNSANNWMVDGADNVDRGSNLTLGTYPSVDAIAEFKVLRGLYDAENGRAGAGQINVVTKSGGNGFHGNAYEFFRNDVIAANNFFNNSSGIRRPPLRYNDFGYTFGGPVYIPGHYNTNKDKTFFFFSQEFRRVITYGTVTALAVPTTGMLTGTFLHPVCTVFAANGSCTTTGTQIATIDPVAQQYISAVFSKLPAPNAPTLGSFTLVSALRNIFNGRQELVRVDHIFGPKLSLAVRYLHDTIPTEEPGGLFTGAALPGVSTTRTNSPGYSWVARATSMFTPTLLNEGGFDFTYSAIVSDPIGLVASANSPNIGPAITLPFPSTLGRIPAVTFTGGSSVTGFAPYDDFNRNYHAYDNVTKILGRHTWKFGFSYNYYQKTENASGVNTGSFSFTNAGAPPAPTVNFEQSWANFLLGRVTTFTQAKADLTPDIREQQFDFYAQDEFKWRKNLTVTFGLRYSRFGQPIDKNHFLSNFDPSKFDPTRAPVINTAGNICTVAPCTVPGPTFATNGATMTVNPNPNYDPLNGIIIAGVNSPFGENISNQNNKDFAPRIGIAWDPFGDGKTSVRSGYGIFYDSTLVGIYEQNIFANPPFAPNVTFNNTNFANPAAVSATNSAAPIALRGTALPSHTPYSQQWSLDVQRQFFHSLVIDIGYYGTNAVHLLGIVDINQIPVGAGIAAGIPAGTATTPPATSGITIYNATGDVRLNQLRPFKGYNAINIVQNRFNSNYHSMQIAVQKRFRGNSLLNIYYTFAHNLTNNQSDRSTAPQNTYNIRAEYGRTQFDRRHVLTTNYVYDLPWMQEQKGWVGHVLGGWEISGIVTFQAGAPLTVTTAGVDSGGLGFLGASAAGGRPDMIFNPTLNAPHTIAQFFKTDAFVAVPTGQIRPGTAGRGVVVGPGIERWDFSLLKNIKLPWESASVQFRTEAFNIWNHTNYSGLGTAQTTPGTFGKVTSTRDARKVQLALKLYF